jgi:ribonuclease HI
MLNGNNNAISGSGIHFPNNPCKDLAVRVPGTYHSNQVGELHAITVTVQASDAGKNLIIISDSEYTVRSLTNRLHKMENEGWTGINNKKFITEAVDTIKSKAGEVAICWTKAHTNESGNKKANELAKLGVKKEPMMWVENKHLGRITGLKLASTKQSLAYHALLQERPIPELDKVSKNLERIQSDMYQGLLKQNPTIDNIWKDLKQTKNIYRT